MALPAESQSLEEARLERIKREEVFALQEAVMSAERLVTHESPDLDALTSLAIAQLYRRFNNASHDVPIAFVAGGIRDFPRGTLALDIGDARGLRSTPSGGLMLKASSAGGSSSMAVARILRDDDYNILETLVKEISQHDEDHREKGTIDRIWSRHRLWPYTADRSALIRTSVFDIFQSLRRSSFDFELYELILRIIEGTLIRGHKRRLFMTRNPWDGVETYYGGRFAILPIGASIYQARALEQQGVEVSLHTVPIKKKRNTWSMALHRAHRVAMNLAELFRGRTGDFPGIFMNESLLGWGVKGGGLPATEPEVQIIRDRFIARMKSVLGPWYSSQH